MVQGSTSQIHRTPLGAFNKRKCLDSKLPATILMLSIQCQFALATKEETLAYVTQICLLHMVIKNPTDYPNKNLGITNISIFIYTMPNQYKFKMSVPIEECYLKNILNFDKSKGKTYI